ncbi:MAG: MarR family transcriptional regulator [Aeromicrobium erythreum]
MTTTRDELFECLETFLTKIFSLAESDAADLLIEMDLSITQARTMFVLGHADGPMAINEIAKRLGLSVASAGRNIDAMVRLGMLERHESPEDRRVKLVSLSDKGWQIADQHFEEKRRALREFVRRVPEPQAAALTEALRPVLAGDALRATTPEENHD